PQCLAPRTGHLAKAQQPPAVTDGHRTSVQSDRLNGLSFVPYDVTEHAGVDVIEIAKDVHMLGCPGVRSNKRGISLQRRLIILNADTASLVEFRDVGVVFVSVGFDDPVGCEGGRATMRVVNDHNVLYAKQVLRNGDGAQRIDGAPSGHDDGEHGCRRCHAMTRGVEHNLSRKDLVSKSLRDGLWDFSRPWIVAVDDQCLEWDCAGEGLSRFCLIKRWARAEGVSIKFTHLCSSLCRVR